MPRMPRMFDWIKVYTHDFMVGQDTDERALEARLAYYTAMVEAFRNNPFPLWWDAAGLDAILAYVPVREQYDDLCA